MEVAEEVISLMRERLAHPLPIEDLARAANYSKFHFCRLFVRATGVTPCRFLSALRLQESRHLLLETDATVSDICCAVGFSSVGTFTSRFKKSVGIPPSVFRSTGGFSPSPLQVDGPDSAEGPGADRHPSPPAIEGKLFAPPEQGPERILLAAFPSPVSEGRPQRCVLLDGPGAWRLVVDHAGVWYVTATTLAPDEARYASSPLLEDQARFVGWAGPVAVGPDRPTRDVEVGLHALRGTDPPILFAPPRRLPPAFADYPRARREPPTR
jgi:AraC-like DNA-binding protein